MKVGAGWCGMLQESAGGASKCRMVKVGARWCTRVQDGAS